MTFDVITIGTTLRDVFLQSPYFKVVRDPVHLKKIGFPTGEAECFAMGGKVEMEKPIFTIGGGAGNTAITFARQGFRTAALVKVGNDKSGEDILSELREEKVMPLVAKDRTHATGYSSILLSPGGERTILTYRGASSSIAKRDIPFTKLNARWGYIVPGSIPLSVITSIVKRLKRGGSRVAMDPSSFYLKMGARKLGPLLRTLDIVKMNREEAALLTGCDYEDEAAIFRKFDALVPGIAIVTDGPRGVAVSDGQRIYRAGIFKEKELKDRTGSGDAFGSGFVAGLMRKDDIEHAIRLGSANATSVVEHVGAHAGILRKGSLLRERRWRSFKIKVYNREQ